MERTYKVVYVKNETFNHDFKVGDVVYVDDYVHTGESGFSKFRETYKMRKITSIEFDDKWAGNYGVSFQEDKKPVRCVVGLRRAGVKSTRLAKKIYPDWEEKNGWLYPKIS